jgi:hypothetical protein
MATQESKEKVTDLQEYGPRIDLPEGVTPAMVQERTGRDKGTISRALRGLLKAEAPAYVDIRQAVADLAGEAYGVTAPAAEAPIRDEAAEAEPLAATREVPYSRGQRLFMGSLQAIVRNEDFGVLTGPSGAGKSHVLRAFRAEHVDHVFFKARSRMSVPDVVSQLCRLFSIADTGSCDARRIKLGEVAFGRLLIVDEADLLVKGRRPAQVDQHIEVFRELAEAGCIVILIGLPILKESIARCCDDYTFSRIGYWYGMSAPTAKELENFWLTRTAGLAGAAPEAKAVAGDARSRGYFRYLDKLEKVARLMDGDVGAARACGYQEGV